MDIALQELGKFNFPKLPTKFCPIVLTTTVIETALVDMLATQQAQVLQGTIVNFAAKMISLTNEVSRRIAALTPWRECKTYSILEEPYLIGSARVNFVLTGSKKLRDNATATKLKEQALAARKIYVNRLSKQCLKMSILKAQTASEERAGRFVARANQIIGLMIATETHMCVTQPHKEPLEALSTTAHSHALTAIDDELFDKYLYVSCELLRTLLCSKLKQKHSAVVLAGLDSLDETDREITETAAANFAAIVVPVTWNLQEEKVDRVARNAGLNDTLRSISNDCALIGEATEATKSFLSHPDRKDNTMDDLVDRKVKLNPKAQMIPFQRQLGAQEKSRRPLRNSHASRPSK